jgi:hypothetical protein
LLHKVRQEKLSIEQACFSREDWDVRPKRKLATQGLAERLAPLGMALAPDACASTPLPGPPVAVLPGTGKDLAAFHRGFGHGGFGHGGRLR